MNPEQSPPQEENIDYSKPVAYDTNGRPLYAHPPTQKKTESSSAPQVVHWTRPLEPLAPHVSEAALEKHKQSIQTYPNLNLSEGEYIISAVRRHPIGLLPIFLVLGTSIIAIVAGIAMYANYAGQTSGVPAVGGIIVIAILLSILLILGGFVAFYVYMSNRFFLTNESVIQEIQHSLFSKHEQTVSLANIEDASYRQEGFLQHMFNYGSIRLSTEGDETTYRFNYVANPKRHIAVLNNAVEAFKNGRPIEDN